MCPNNDVFLYHQNNTIILERCNLERCSYRKSIFIISIASQFNYVIIHIHYLHLFGSHLYIILPQWMYSVKIVHSDCIAFISLNIFLNYESTIASVIMSRYILSILETYMIRRVKYNLST